MAAMKKPMVRRVRKRGNKNESTRRGRAAKIRARLRKELPVDDTRDEKDTMGVVKVPANALYGAQTQRAVENFPVSGQRMPRYFIAAIAHLKSACAEVNLALKPARMTAELCKAIQEACAEVAQGKHDEHFPIDVFQTGSGTSTNMNANEVLANLVNRKMGGTLGVYKPAHPN